MIRLYILVEGDSEEKFTKHVLAPHLQKYNVWAYPIIVTTRAERDTGQKSRGGGHWKHWRKDLHRLTQQHSKPQDRFTTLFDLYGLPDDFPKLESLRSEPDTIRRAERLQEAMSESIGDWRLIPYLQRHEFEALVLACLGQLRELLDPAEHAGFDALRGSLGQQSPEDINDGKSTAPSKRLKAHIPNYTKTLHGPLALEAAGLDVIRTACPRFDAWLKVLESLAPQPPP